LQDPIYIKAQCVINQHVVYKNGSSVFEMNTANAQEFLQSLYHHLSINYPKFYKMDMLCKLGFLATEILLQPSVVLDKYDPYKIGVILSNAQSSLDADCKFHATMNTNPSPSLFVYTLPNILIGEICIRHQIKGESAFFVFEKFNAVFLEKYVESLFNNNNLQACIVGWVDLLGEDYKAVLFYLEKEKSENAINFTAENISKIYQIENG